MNGDLQVLLDGRWVPLSDASLRVLFFPQLPFQQLRFVGNVGRRSAGGVGSVGRQSLGGFGIVRRQSAGGFRFGRVITMDRRNRLRQWRDTVVHDNGNAGGSRRGFDWHTVRHLELKLRVFERFTQQDSLRLVLIRADGSKDRLRLWRFC